MAFTLTFLLLLTILHLGHGRECINFNSCERNSRRSNITSMLECLKYEKNVSPTRSLGKDEQQIKVDIKPLAITEFDIFKQSMTISVKIRFEWTDSRLSWSKGPCNEESKTFGMTITNLLWTPDIDRLIQAGNTIQENLREVKLEWNYNGDMKLTKVLDIRQELCAMNFFKFPFDKQVCKIMIPFKQSSDEVIIEWAEDRNNEELIVPEWIVNIVPEPICSKMGKFQEEIACMKLRIVFDRLTSSHVLQTYMPSIMLSIASAGSVFIPYHQVPGRMGLCVTSFLAMIALFTGAKSDWPRTSYLKAIEVWSILCYVGAFTWLLEFCIVLFVAEGEHQVEPMESGLKQVPRKALLIEKSARLAAPLYIVIVVIVYFLACLT